MFARATSRSYKCIRCQYRLNYWEARSIESTNVLQWASQRWQSSATKLDVREENEDEIADVEHRAPITYENSFSAQTFRTWRPTPTAEIGTEVLGKPAEILLLPAKQRRRREELDDTDDVHADVENATSRLPLESMDSVQPSLHEFLAQESKPTSMKGALENIDKIRKEAMSASENGFLKKQEWTNYFTALSKGFTKKQIERYLTENFGGTETMPVDNTVLSRTLTRTRAATEIMTRIWGLSTSKELPATSDPLVKKTINLGRGRRELIMGVDREWRRFLKHGSIISSPVPGHVEIAGPESWTRKVETVFASLKRTAEERSLVLPRVYARALDEQNTASDLAVRSVLSELVQKHQVTLTKDSGWKVYGYGEQRVASFERDLLLSQREASAQLESSAKSSFLSLSEVKRELAAPFCTDQFAREADIWYRYSEFQPREDGADSSRGHAVDNSITPEFIDNLNNCIYDDQANTLSYSFPQRYGITTGSMHTEVSAAVGQVLHQSAPEPEVTDKDGVHAARTQTRFGCRIPFLSQYLGQLKKLPAEASSDGVNDTLISLTFMPSDIHTHPEIEVKASVPISADFAHVLLPTTLADIQLVRRPVVPIFQEGSPVQERFAPLLGELGSQVREEQDNHTLGVRSIQLKTLLNLSLTHLQSAGKVKNPPGQEQDTSTLVRYALDKAEIYEKQRYQVLGHEDLVLEHEACSPFKSSSSQALADSLRIFARNSAMGDVHRSSCEKLLKGALQVVQSLSAFVNDKTGNLALQREEHAHTQDVEEKST